MGCVKSLPLSEPVRIDKRRMSDIFNELGERTARHVIAQSLQRLETSLTTTDQALACNDYANAVAHANVLARLAWQIGLPALAAVAQNLGNCVEQCNLTALAAVRARLLRVGDNSLAALRDNAEIG